jgi:HD-like signal output (HDOD) protein
MAIEFIEEVKRTITTSLPTSSVIVGEIVNTIYNKRSSAADLSAIIERDPPLSAEILKTANSAYYGLSNRVTSLTRAVVCLGFDVIREIVITVSVVQNMFVLNPESPIDRMGLWQHSVGTAKAAQLIAGRVGGVPQDFAYTVGLLHDLGKILLSLCYPEHYARVIELATEKKCRGILAERKILNTDHCMIGKVLCEIWNLPEELATGIFFHHDLMDSPRGSHNISRLIHLADCYTRKAQIGNPGDNLIPDPSPVALSLLGTTPEHVQTMNAKLYKEFFRCKDDIMGFYSSLGSRGGAANEGSLAVT